MTNIIDRSLIDPPVWRDTWVHTVPYVENGQADFINDTWFALTAKRIVVRCSSGSCTVQLQWWDGSATNLGTSMTVSSTLTTQTLNVSIPTGTAVWYIVSNNSDCRNARIQFDYERSLF